MERVPLRFCLPLFLSLFLGGCSLHEVNPDPRPQVCLPKSYEQEQGARWVDRWWQEFGSDDLNCWVERVLSHNHDLKQAWARLAQAYALIGTAGSAKYPQIDLTLTGGYDNTEDKTPLSLLKNSSSRFGIGSLLAYEVDLWGRISSLTDSARYGAAASREDLEATALVLTGTATDLWLIIQEQRELYQLLQDQIATNKTQLDLIELRFSLGQASALDVYQQRQQLAATEAEVPPVLATMQTAFHQLRVLAGCHPHSTPSLEGGELPNLPPMPKLGVPCDLLFRRPDLKAARYRIVAADHQVGAAIADRLPQLSFSLSYDFGANTLGDLFELELFSSAANLVTPLVDGGRRRAEVDRTQAVVCEALHYLNSAMLQALQEVEDSLTREKYQLELLQRLDHQLEYARINVREAKSRYSNGLDDYLSVISAVQITQNLERRLVSERRGLVTVRGQLYRSLGGCWTNHLQPCGLTRGKTG